MQKFISAFKEKNRSLLNHTMASQSQQRVSTKTEDFLDEDSELRGQKYVCLSFLSPEDAIANKDAYVFSQFVKQFGVDMAELFSNIKERFVDDPSVHAMVDSIQDKYTYISNTDELQAEYGIFKDINGNKLEAEYLEKNDFQTSMRGIKVRGSYETVKEAQIRAETIKKFDGKFNVYVAQVGCWCPWSPYPEDIENVEYSETELNTLMKKYKESQTKKDELYQIRKGDMIEKVKMHAAKQKESVGGGVSIVQEIEEDEEPESASIQGIQGSLDSPDTWPKSSE